MKDKIPISISRREFFKQLGKIGLTMATLPPAMNAFLKFHQSLWAEDPALPRKGWIEARYYEKLDDNRIKCTLCPNFHIYKPEDVSFCFNRFNQKGVWVSSAYNNPCTINVDPIEKGPFNHFLPGTNTLSIGLGGCNLRCLYCQNWQVAMARPERVAICDFTKEDCADALVKKECRTICYTYTEPMMYPEYLKEVAGFTRKKGVYNVVCTAGFVNPEPLKDICSVIDGFAVTLKAFSDKFYQKICGQTLAPVLKSLEIIKSQKKHLEIINLIVPSYNDDLEIIKEMCQWVKKNLGPDVVLHFGRFYPEYKLKTLPPTPAKTIESARQIGLDAGLKYVYTFNLAPHEGNYTFCPSCKKPVIKRLGFKVLENNLPEGICKECGYKIPGVWK